MMGHAHDGAPQRPRSLDRTVGPSNVHAAQQSRRARAEETATALRFAFQYRQPTGWKLDAIAACLGADRADVSRWMNAHEAMPVWLVEAMPEDVRARYLDARHPEMRMAA